MSCFLINLKCETQKKMIKEVELEFITRKKINKDLASYKTL